MSDLILDPNIRTWVFVPIIIMTFLLGVVKHYLSLCLDKDVTTELQEIQDKHILLRCRALRTNASYIPKNSFHVRLQYFNNEINSNKTNSNNNNNNKPLKPKENLTNFDPNAYINVLKNNLINIFPMFITGSWIVYMYSDFIATKLPFSLTLRFKSMLQKSMSLDELNEPWISSASWYFLCVFGLRNIFNVLLGENNMADPSKSMEENLAPPINGQVDQALDYEIEELRIIQHDWILKELIE